MSAITLGINCCICKCLINYIANVMDEETEGVHFDADNALFEEKIERANDSNFTRHQAIVLALIVLCINT